jgi:O-antigen/teichoic acid export membrane protein
MHVILFVAAPAVVYFFFPERYSSSAPILMVLALASFFLAIASGLAAVLQGLSHARVPAVIMTVSVGVQLAALWWLVPAIGPIGAAVASALAGALACSLLLYQVRALPFAPLRIGTQLAALGVLALALAPLPLFFSEAPRALIAVWIALSAALYVATAIYFGLVSIDELRLRKRSA